MAVTVRWRGATVRGEGGQFASFLGKKWNEIGERLIQHVDLRGGEGAKMCAEDLKEASVALAPKDTGRLRESCFIDPVESAKGTKYDVSFDTARAGGRADFNYAYIQHENHAYKHKEGQSNFLRQPYLERKEMYKEIIAMEVKKGVGEAAK